MTQVTKHGGLEQSGRRGNSEKFLRWTSVLRAADWMDGIEKRRIRMAATVWPVGLEVWDDHLRG